MDVTKTIYAAYDESEAFIGYAITGESVGFADMIGLIYGYNPQTKRVIGIKVLESLETPGLGDKIKTEKNPAFAAQFADLASEPEIMVVKDGKDADNEIDAITGATISSKAVARAVNATNQSWVQYLPEEPPEYVPPVEEPAEEEAAEQTGEGH